ncbi:hypothetical protein BM1_10554 [Bipolaris maydis]|uniref:uncharacterized protein n=1 Tax=Cochliobolus heterostrophus TaxID=5016 RepID=UPI0024D7D480|nr:hypothetical protein BM1_10554 [Bipolaris maydis]KAJ5024468.1 hypothetical protein J3E73DRAFT_425402 [Bipolaris maydis]KAJ6268306.1 hypothetical protein PSV08DRAFT_378390 [Bipolaris maydis]KAJ6278555.1 hypothetical protein J3E71DRAFT_401743 [Bipolaris maydis]
MHAATALISLLVFATSISAAPVSTQAVARAVPDISEVARNPAPIDNRVHWEDGKPSLGDIGNISWEDLRKLKELMHHLSGGNEASNTGTIGEVKTSVKDHGKFHS